MLDNVNYILYYIKMIKSFRHKGLEELHQEGKTRRIRPDFVRKCAEILMYLEAAHRPESMNIAGYYFHGLHGNPRRWSVRVNRNFRITFAWDGENAVNVDLEDYH